MVSETTLSATDLIYPMFSAFGTGIRKEISSMPGIYQQSIEYIVEECPFSHDAIQLQYKEVLNQLEQRSPGTKHSFVLGFMREGRKAFAEATPVQLKECPSCGYPTTGEICGFCRLQQEVHRAKSGVRN